MADAMTERCEKSYRLYNPNIFIILGVFFSFLLPGILFSINVGNLGNRAKRNRFFVLFSLLAAVLFASAYLLGSYAWGVSKYALIGINAAVSAVLLIRQRSAYREWRARGGKPRSPIPPVCISLVPAAALVFLMIVIPLIWTREYTYEGHVLRCTSEITEADIAATAARLKEIGLFTPGESVFTLKLQRKGDELQLLFPVKKEAVDSESIIVLLAYIEGAMNSDPYFRNALRVIQSDENLNPIP